MDGPTEDEIKKRAHKLWEDAGGPGGKEKELEFWFEAKKQLRDEFTQKKIATARKSMAKYQRLREEKERSAVPIKLTESIETPKMIGLTGGEKKVVLILIFLTIFLAIVFVVFELTGVYGIIITLLIGIFIYFLYKRYKQKKSGVSGGARAEAGGGGKSLFWKSYRETFGKWAAEKGLAKIGLKIIIPVILIILFLIWIAPSLGLGGAWLWIILFGFAFLVISYAYGIQVGFGFVVIGIIVFAIFYQTNIGRGLTERFGVDIKASLDKWMIGAKLQAKEIESKATGVGEWRNPYAEEVKEKRGIEITDIKPVKQNFLPGEDIEIVGMGFIKALDEPTSVSFTCSMDKLGGQAEPKNLNAPAKLDTPFSTRCTFISVKKPSEDIAYKTAKFIAKYSGYKTWGRLRLYTLNEDKLKELTGTDPFDYYGIRDNLLDARYRTTTSTYKYGPLKISMYVANRQPLSPGKYLLSIGVDSDKMVWGGELATSESNKLILKFPKNLQGVDGKCEKEFKIKEGATYYCEFEIKDIEEDLSFVEIEAEAIYDYEFSKDVQVIIAKQEAPANLPR